MADVTRRLLALLAALQTGRAFAGDELAARLAVSPRTLRRDVERLREYGYPVRTQPGPGGYYRLAAGTTVPPLLFEDDEALATLLGLALLSATGNAGAGSLDDAATRAYGKVDQFLPKRLRPRAAALRAGLETGALAAPGADAATLGALADAIHQHRVVTFEYAGAEGASSARRVEPHRQIHLRLRWYLLAWDTDRRDWRSSAPTASPGCASASVSSPRARCPPTPESTTCARDSTNTGSVSCSPSTPRSPPSRAR
ncbi:helix-turn-helix transcriptional regulator [Nocardia farcinica]